MGEYITKFWLVNMYYATFYSCSYIHLQSVSTATKSVGDKP